MTQRLARLIGLVLGLLVGAAPAAVAQDEPRFALVVSFPSPAVSFQWELSEKLALRFEGSYHYESSELTESSSLGGATEHVYLNGTSSQVIFTSLGGDYRSESTTHSGSIGIAGIFTIHRSDQLRLYVAPRATVALTRQHFTRPSIIRLPSLTPGLPDATRGSDTFEYSSTSPGAGVSFGAATNVHRHLALFGEAGFSYFRTNIPPVGTTTTLTSLNDFNVKSSNINTRAVGGLMLLF